ncbi:MAG: hypothetical protein AABZ31_01140 [Bdellovibrionota bacterium]
MKHAAVAVSPVVTFKGFHPSDYTVNYIESVLDHIREESPYGAALRATFKRENNVIRGMINVTSSAGKFFAIAEGSRLHEVSQRLNHQLRRQLSKWKKLRFHRGE